MEEDLGLEGDDYQIAVSLLFVTYVMCEVPSNLIIKRLRPSRYIAFITVSWGIVATLTGVVQSFGGLIAVRLILGALEAGLFPGMAIYLVREKGILELSVAELALRHCFIPRRSLLCELATCSCLQRLREALEAS
jgi:fucose permease